MLKNQKINPQSLCLVFLAAFFIPGSPLWGQSDATVTNSTSLLAMEDSGSQSIGPASGGVASLPAGDSASSGKPKPAPPSAHRVGPFNISVNWRFRTEAWDLFEPSAGQNAYAFEHSLLKIGIGQKSEAFEWLLEGA